MASGLLSLKWNHHRSTFLHVLANIRQKESYCDVTLACDGKFYSAHKLVLSTCSEYFEGMFDRTRCKHPVIVLKDIRSDELEALLSYMYDGEVNVLQENLSSLIKAAECLRIKGLAVADHDPSEKLSGGDKSNSRSHNSSSNGNYHGDGSSNSSRQFRNNSSSSGIKRPSSSSKQDDTQSSKRRRPAGGESSSPGQQQQRTSRRSSSSDTGLAPTEDVAASSRRPGHSDKDDPIDVAAPDDERTFAQGLIEDTGVKAEPVEVLDPDIYEPQQHDKHEAGQIEFTEEKFTATSAANSNDDNSMWSNAEDDSHMFSQPSTSSFTGAAGGEDNDTTNIKAGSSGSSAAPVPSPRNNWSCSPLLKSSPPSSPNIDVYVEEIDPNPDDFEVFVDNSISSLPAATLNAPAIIEQEDPLTTGALLHSDESIKCLGCAATFLSLERYRNHVSRDHINDGYYYCQMCPYRHNELGNLFNHQSTHFRRQSVENVPSRTVTNSPTSKSSARRPFGCTVCGKHFTSSTKLSIHHRTHTGEKPYACPECDYRATQSNNLKSHMFSRHPNSQHIATQKGNTSSEYFN